MDLLCSDKTGTLTLNKLSIETQSLLPTNGLPILEVLKYAALSANTVTEEPIDMVLFESYPEAVRAHGPVQEPMFYHFKWPLLLSRCCKSGCPWGGCQWGK